MSIPRIAAAGSPGTATSSASEDCHGNWAEVWASFYKGESALAIEELILNLVENTGARRRPSKVQEHLDELERFWRHEVLTLAKVRKATGCGEWPVPQYKRDLVFLSYKAGVTSIEDGVKSATAPASLPAFPKEQCGDQQA